MTNAEIEKRLASMEAKIERLFVRQTVQMEGDIHLTKSLEHVTNALRKLAETK